MIWANVRFVIGDNGDYADRWVQLDTDDFAAAAIAAKALCAGYTVGSGRRAAIMNIDTTSHANSMNLSPEGVQAQHNHLKSLTRRSA